MTTLLRLAKLVAARGLELRIDDTEIAIVDPTRPGSCENQLDHHDDLEECAAALLDRYTGFCDACEASGHSFTRCPVFAA